MIIKLSRIQLHPWQKGFEEGLVKYANNPNIAQNLRDMFPHPYTLEDAQKWIHFNERSKTLCNFAILDDSGVIGAIGVQRKTDVHRKTAELGYWLGEPFWGKGIMTEAIKGFLPYVFDNLGMNRIFAAIFGFNKGSMRTAEKSGFQKECVHREEIYKNGRFFDEHVYVLLKSEYQAKLRQVSL